MTKDVNAAAYLAIGNEILSGRTKEKNLETLANFLNPKGIPIVEARVVRDQHHAIVEAVQTLRKRADILVTSGGIGPTHDDITTQAIADAFSLPLQIDLPAYKALEDHYAKIGESMTQPRIKMTLLPEGASPIDNPVSIAPGFRIDNVYVLAGVPQVFKAMLEGLRVRGKRHVYQETLETTLGESRFAAALSDLQKQYPQTEIGSYPRIDQSGKAHWHNAIVVKDSEQPRVRVVAEKVRSVLETLEGDPNIKPNHKGAGSHENC